MLRLVCTFIPTSLPGGTGKRRLGIGVQWTCFGVRVPRTLDYPTIKLKSFLKCIVRSQYTPVPDRRTDRRTDEHHGNSATRFVLTSASGAKILLLVVNITYCMYSKNTQTKLNSQRARCGVTPARFTNVLTYLLTSARYANGSQMFLIWNRKLPTAR